ncbi:MAG: hypothetical protein AAFR31_15600 [Cyanobacteria bacterium J06627_8]
MATLQQSIPSLVTIRDSIYSAQYQHIYCNRIDVQIGLMHL